MKGNTLSIRYFIE